MKTLLSESWERVEQYYKNNWINSEHSLQAILFHSMLQAGLPDNYRIHVEPSTSFDKFIPDMVIVDDKYVKCVLEIKCSPHGWVMGDKLYKDIEKLEYYSEQKIYRSDVFGPTRIFDYKNNKWQDGKPEIELNMNTVFGFVVITRSDAESADINKIMRGYPKIKNIRNFNLMLGAISPDLERKDSNYEFKVIELNDHNGA